MFSNLWICNFTPFTRPLLAVIVTVDIDTVHSIGYGVVVSHRGIGVHSKETLPPLLTFDAVIGAQGRELMDSGQSEMGRCGETEGLKTLSEGTMSQRG